MGTIDFSGLMQSFAANCLDDRPIFLAQAQLRLAHDHSCLYRLAITRVQYCFGFYVSLY